MSNEMGNGMSNQVLMGAFINVAIQLRWTQIALRILVRNKCSCHKRFFRKGVVSKGVKFYPLSCAVLDFD